MMPPHPIPNMPCFDYRQDPKPGFGPSCLTLKASQIHTMKHPWLRFALKHTALPVITLISTLVAAPLALAMEPAPAPKAERYRELVHIVRQDCGSCHGLTLRGGLGPALTANALADKPAEGLAATIIGGRPGTAMPPFRGIVSEAEAEWIVDQLMRGFPPDRGLAPSGAQP